MSRRVKKPATRRTPARRRSPTRRKLNQIELCSFAGACLRLHLKVDGPLRNVEVSLCEDNRSVMLYAPDGHGHWVCASFDLGRQVKERDFDPTPYLQAFE